MKAVVYTEYGSPDVMRLAEVEKPAPKDHDVLVKVHAVSVNRSDWEALVGKPLYARMDGLFRPSVSILGADIAGRVEAVGSAVREFQVGDEVFGETLRYHDGFAEYVCVPEKAMLRKPAWMSFAEAAAMPQAGGIAVQAMRDKGQVKAGHQVLINGAGGGAGTYAVQLAKCFGAEVTGVDNTGKLEFLRSLGADHVIDYTREDFTRTGKQYDLILDVIAHRSVFAYQRALKPGGRYYLVGGSVASMFQILFLGRLIRNATGKRIRILVVRPNRDDLKFLIGLREAGKITTVIDREYPLSEVPDALRYLGEGHAKGKVVITIP